MKVLVITTGFLESTLSLAKTISNKGIDVEVLCTNSKTRRNLNVINFSKIKSLKTWITKEDLRTLVNDDFYRFLSHQMTLTHSKMLLSQLFLISNCIKT